MEEMAENPQTQDVPETSATDLAELKEKGCILYSKVKIYDVVFKRFFAVDENVKKFYESVSNRKIRLEDIERVTLEEGKSPRFRLVTLKNRHKALWRQALCSNSFSN